MTDPTHHDPTPHDPTHHDLRQVLHDAHAFYLSQVGASWVPHHLNRRNLYPRMAPARIGYAQPGWTTTVDHLRGLGYSDRSIEAAGLARRSSTGNLVDVFRDRLMVPLTDRDQQLVGFIGRRSETAGDDVPKYLNSPQTALFAKHDVLNGLGEDTDQLRHGTLPILVEGPMDRLAINQAASSLNVTGLAPCGTALTRHQVAALVSVTSAHRPIAVALDPDSAGRAATLRAWELLTAAGAKNLMHVQLPNGRDPAELVRNGRASVLRDAITNRRPLALTVADQRIAEASPDPDNALQRASIARHVLQHDLRHVPPEQVSRYITHLSHQLTLHVEIVTAHAVEVVTANSMAASSPRSHTTHRERAGPVARNHLAVRAGL